MKISNSLPNPGDRSALGKEKFSAMCQRHGGDAIGTKEHPVMHLKSGLGILHCYGVSLLTGCFFSKAE